MDEKQADELAKTVAPDCDLKVEFSLPENCEVQFIGEPIPALDQATNNLAVPARFLHHPLVENRYFFTLPGPLWDMILRELDKGDFDEDAVEMERTLSAICGDHSSNAGFWNGLALSYHLLRSVQKRMPSAERTASLGWKVSQAKLDNAVCRADERSAWFRRTARAYAGWLLTNRAFLDEHDLLLARWSDMVGRWGLDRLGMVLPTGGFSPGNDPTADARWSDYRTAFEEFFTRWRLQGLAAPYLLVPLPPLLGGSFPTSVLPQVNRAGGAYCYPDTFPVPSRDDFRNLMEEVLRGGDAPEHLQDWMALISGNNPAKKPLLRYARLFELQHYWRILRRRHARPIHRKLGKLKRALAEFLNVVEDSIHRDLLFVSKRLGKDWFERGGSFPFGPF